MVSEEFSTFSTKSITVGDNTIEVRNNSNAARQTVILLHGMAMSERYFRRLANLLSPSYYVISINQPGSGGSAKPHHVPNLDELAGTVTQFIRQEGIIRPVIIGHSMGCQIAARLSLVADLSVRKLILVSPAVNRKERTAPMQFFRLAQDMFSEPLDSNVLAFSDYVKFGFLRILKMQRFMMAGAIEELLAKIPQPVMIIRGENDKIVPRDWVLYLSTVLVNGFSVEIPGAPHNVQYTHPGEVAAICSNFLEQ